MDVSNINLEEVLVDYQTIEPGDGDISGKIDEEWVCGALLDIDRDEEKVMVSIRSVFILYIITPTHFNPESVPPMGHPQLSSHRLPQLLPSTPNMPRAL